MNPFAVLLAFIFIVSATAPAIVVADEAEGETGPYPIWLSPHSVIKSLNDVERAWNQSFKINLIDGKYVSKGYALYKGENENRIIAVAGSCYTLIELVDQKFDLIHRSFYYPSYLRVVEDCRYLDLLRQVSPSTVSFVRNFDLDEQAVNLLPALIKPGISCHTMCQLHEANERGIPLSRFSELTKIEPRQRYRLDMETVGMAFQVSLLAKGDFDGDGTEDLILQVNFEMKGGTLWGRNLHVLTRLDPSNVLQVVDPDSHICEEYTCPLSFPKLDALWEDDQ